MCILKKYKSFGQTKRDNLRFRVKVDHFIIETTCNKKRIFKKNNLLSHKTKIPFEGFCTLFFNIFRTMGLLFLERGGGCLQTKINSKNAFCILTFQKLIKE